MDYDKILRKILRKYGAATDNIRTMQVIESKLKKHTATYADANKYAQDIGGILTDIFREHLPEALTDGKLYRAAAEVLVQQPMVTAGRDVAEVTKQIQKAMNEEAGIGMNAVDPGLNQDQIDGIITGICNAESYDNYVERFMDQVEGFFEGEVDDFVRENADFQYKAGLSPTIERKISGKCCSWCAKLAGTYPYEDVKDRGNDVFRRHNNCHCQILYNPADGSKKRQNAHSKIWTEDNNPAIIEARKAFDPTAEETERSAVHEMANGPRRGPLQHVTAEEEREIRAYADELKIPQDSLSFNTGSRTSFDDNTKRINIRGDIFPADYAPNPESILNERCVLAHEYYGHMKHDPSYFAIGDWRDEFRASYTAALETPNLTDDERRLLMIDAFDRAKTAGVTITMNKEARRVIYGFE